jgi:aspartyl-tRNA synthetase
MVIDTEASLEANFQRSHYCHKLRYEDINSTVVLAGWVNRRRDHGGLIFIDLRDRYGITQLVFDPKVNEEAHEKANQLRSEWVISIEGKVISRAEGMANPKLPTGEIEVEVDTLHILSQAKTPPFSICDEQIDTNEEIRLKYRYLDIRRGEIIHKLHIRHKAMLTTRNYFDKKGFMEVNTPIMGKSTPEGARDYLVPSRVYPGNCYALPQSPQIFKQLLMVSGIDKYFQIAPCFRDEDLRADRQPEFTQLDLEMSFANEEVLFPLMEEWMHSVFAECIGIDIPTPFRRIPYQECLDRYGTDKPDLRFGMELHNLDEIVRASSFTIFLEQLENGNTVKGLCVKGGASFSRRIIDEYTRFVGNFGIKGLAWMKYTEEGLSSSIVKFFPEAQQKQLVEKMGIEKGDLIFMIAESLERTNQSLDHLRRKIAKDLNLIDENSYEFLWVTDFPLFHWNAEENRLESEHHPFTAPSQKDLHLLESDPVNVRSSSYDLVVNGYELASGSQRIYNNELQNKIFQLLKLSEDEISNRFGFFVNALKYGTPPHMGIGLGLDRLIMILTKTENIRDVIAFPKTQKATDLMLQAPSEVAHQQLTDLGITTIKTH